MAKAEYIWAIGDIHGYTSSLSALLNRINEFNTKRIVFLGDYIDRGPEPKEVIDIIIDQKVDKVALLGNHELMLLNSISEGKSNTKSVFVWSENGYETTLRSFEAGDVTSLEKTLEGKYLEFFKSLSLFHVETFSSGKKSINILFSHAGPFVNNPITEQLDIKNYESFLKYISEKKIDPENTCLTNTDSLLQDNIQSWAGYFMVHGHMRTQYRHDTNRLQYGDNKSEFNDELSDIPSPLYVPNKNIVTSLGIDTGIDIGGKLTAVGFSKENIDFGSGKMKIKVIQAESERRNKNVPTLVFDLTISFSDDYNFVNKLMKSIFTSDKKKSEVKDKPHQSGNGHHAAQSKHGSGHKTPQVKKKH